MSYAPCWYAYINGQVQGPFTPEQLAAMAKGGAIRPDTPLCGDGRNYVAAGQALPQLFAPAAPPMPPRMPPPASHPIPPPMAGQQAPPMAPPVAPYAGPPIGPPMMPRPTGRRGGKTALLVGLGAAAAAAAVVVILLLSSGGGGGGALLSSLAAELPAGKRFEFADIDAMESLGEDAPRDLDLDEATGLPRALRDELPKLFPKGKRGAVAVARRDDERVRVYCPRALDEAALTKLLEGRGFEKRSADGVELWVSGPGRGECIALKKGRIYSGEESLVKDVLLGKLAPEGTMARSEGCRELLARVSSSPVLFEMRKHSRGPLSRSERPEPTWSAQDISVSGSRIQARQIALFASAEEAERAIKELDKERPEIEAKAKQGRGLPFRNVELQSLDWVRRDTLIIATGVFKRTGGGGSPQGK